MALKQVTPELAARELVMLYGAPGSGKTRLATSLPPRFGKVAYFAMDDGSESLASVLPHYRERITVFKPEWKDPLADGLEITHVDWKAKGFDTFIVDTFSTWTQRTLDHIVHKGLAQANHRGTGTPGSLNYVALPDQADYGLTHAAIRNFVGFLGIQQREMNVILICHQTFDKDDKENRAAIGGPTTVGRAMIEWLPARFSTVIRMDRTTRNVVKGNKVESETKLVARMAQHGAWIARRNEASTEGNQLAAVELDIDPTNFWTLYDKKENA